MPTFCVMPPYNLHYFGRKMTSKCFHCNILGPPLQDKTRDIPMYTQHTLYLLCLLVHNRLLYLDMIQHGVTCWLLQEPSWKVTPFGNCCPDPYLPRSSSIQIRYEILIDLFHLENEVNLTTSSLSHPLHLPLYPPHQRQHMFTSPRYLRIHRTQRWHVILTKLFHLQHAFHPR